MKSNYIIRLITWAGEDLVRPETVNSVQLRGVEHGV